MQKPHPLRFALPLLALLASPAAAAPGDAAPGDAALAKAVLMKGVGFATVKGRGNVPAYAAYLKSVLVEGGFAPGDITITPVGETAILHLAWKGSGKKKPIAVIAHMDVVEADPKDWVRDPFVATQDGDYLFGRGVGDNKFDLSMIVTALVRLKAQGFKPGRDIHVFVSGDEETDGTTAAIQAKEAKALGVEFVLNGDAGGGELDGAGRPVGYSLSGAEKAYGDFHLVVTNPGGHSSRPTYPNAIAELAATIAPITDYRFPAQANEITRASMAAAGAKRSDALGKAMTAFAANPEDAAAIAVLRTDPGTIGQIGTTCVPTMITGGHAPNALPQRAMLTVNCRIFPGVPPESIRKQLEVLANDPAIKVTLEAEWPPAPASPLRPDIMAAVTKAVAPRGVKPVPGMDAGASDSVFYRALGMPSYGVAGLFMRDQDVFIHGLNERIPVSAIAPAVDHWQVLLTELAK